MRADGGAEGEVAFWRCANERAQAQSAAVDIERLIVGEGVSPGQIAVLVPAISREGQAVAVALEERAVAHRVVGEAAFFRRAEIRDVLAWLRLLADPTDAAAVVRALARPPIELRSVDIARCTQIARRRKLDMVAALAARSSRRSGPRRRASGSAASSSCIARACRRSTRCARPVRAPADRPARAPPPAAVRRPGRRRAAPARARAIRRARRRLRAALPAGDAARVRPPPSPRSPTSACASTRSPTCSGRRWCRSSRSTAQARSRSSTCTCWGSTPGYRRRARADRDRLRRRGRGCSQNGGGLSTEPDSRAGRRPGTQGAPRCSVTFCTWR